MMLHSHTGFAGEFQIQAHQIDADGNEVAGTRRTVADWFPNLITDGGLDMIPSGGFMNACQVGSGSATPTFSDVTLQTRVAGVTGSRAAGTPGTSPYYTEVVGTYVFGQGVATGNLSEIGVSPATTGAMFSRALILDGSGNPTTITILAIEVLTVTYRLRVYRNTSDVGGSVTIDSTSYTTVSRPSNINYSNSALLIAQNGIVQTSDARLGAYNGSIGAITGVPSGGGEIATSSVTKSIYGAGNYYQDQIFSVPTSSGNLSGGITCLAYVLGNQLFLGTQSSFSPALPKDNTKTMTVTFRYSWGRHTP